MTVLRRAQPRPRPPTTWRPERSTVGAVDYWQAFAQYLTGSPISAVRQLGSSGGDHAQTFVGQRPPRTTHLGKIYASGVSGDLTSIGADGFAATSDKLTVIAGAWVRSFGGAIFSRGLSGGVVTDGAVELYASADLGCLYNGNVGFCSVTGTGDGETGRAIVICAVIDAGQDGSVAGAEVPLLSKDGTSVTRAGGFASDNTSPTLGTRSHWWLGRDTGVLSCDSDLHFGLVLDGVLPADELAEGAIPWAQQQLAP